MNIGRIRALEVLKLVGKVQVSSNIFKKCNQVLNLSNWCNQVSPLHLYNLINRKC